MPYCTLDDLKKAIPAEVLVNLTDDKGLGEIDTDKVNKAISGADGVINSYLSGRYAVPLAPVPDGIQRCSIDISIYNLYMRRFEEIPETRRLAYTDAIKFLEKVASGVISLPVSASGSGDFSVGTVVTSPFTEAASLPGLEGS